MKLTTNVKKEKGLYHVEINCSHMTREKIIKYQVNFSQKFWVMENLNFLISWFQFRRIFPHA